MTAFLTYETLTDTNNYKINGVQQAGYPKTITLQYIKSQAQGAETANFYKRKARGELLPLNQWFQTSTTHDYAPGTWTIIRTSNGTTQVHTGLVPFDVNNHHLYYVPGIVGNADTAYAMSELQRAANSIYGKGYDALTGLAEAHKIKRMFLKTAKRLDTVIRNTRKLSREEILDAWTEGRYGYRTLAYDIRDLNESINHFDQERRIWTEKSGYSTNSSASSVVTLSWTSQTISIPIVDTTSHSIRGTVVAQIKPARFTVNPLVTGWELVPYSFILDWALSVGDALGTAMLLATADKTYAAIGVESKTTRSWKSHSVFKAGYTGSGSYSYTGEHVQVTRTPTSLSMKPTLRGRIIRPDQVLDLTAIFHRERKRIN